MYQGYFGSDKMADDLYIDSWYKIAEEVAKKAKLGWYTILFCMLYCRIRRYKLILYYKFIWDGTYTDNYFKGLR